MGVYFCIDVGGTEIKGGVVDSSYSLLFSDKIKTVKSSDGNDLVKSLLTLIKKLEEVSKTKIESALGLGIAFPGLTDGKNGVLKYIPSLNIENFKVVKSLKKHIKIPIKIANDAELALLTEYTLGAGKDFKNILLLTLGTGVGCGLIVNGKPLRTTLPYSCEFGHSVMDGNEYENLSSTRALIEQTKKAMQENPSSKMWQKYDLNTVTGKTVFEFKDTDACARAVFDSYIRTLGTQIVNLYNVFTPEIIIIGGGMSSQSENLTKPLEDFINENIFLKIINKKVAVKSAKYFNSAGILGARCLFK